MFNDAWQSNDVILGNTKYLISFETKRRWGLLRSDKGRKRNRIIYKKEVKAKLKGKP